MGLFDIVGGAIKQANENRMEAELEAANWDPIRICKELDRCSQLTTCMGYSAALRKQCIYISDYELQEVYDFARRQRNVKALNTLRPIMEDRGLLY